MDKKQAQRLIKETFETSFDKNKFLGFINNLLNDVEKAAFIYKGTFIPDAFKQYINSLERIGKYSDSEHKIDILIVKLKKETSIALRTMQRNFIAWYLNGSRGGELKDAALVAFVSPNEEDWRFSLVKMDYRFEEGKNGRMKIKEEFTPARRWSFLVGSNENSHTAQSQLVDILADDEKCPNLSQLEEAFNIEKVTREFFEKYRDLFLLAKKMLDNVVNNDKKIKADFETKGVNTIDFAKKLLGQIVFLYFLQKKGWFGVKRDVEWGTGSKNFLRELFAKNHGDYNNFFNDILEPLFYEALARERDDNFYSRFNCKIPFLNGGLFDPINNYDWVHTDILLSNDLFSNTYKTKEGDTGNGILDIFDRYNFTVKEDEPLEKEVAVDPEMLGKVFENLLEVKDRKSKGTYYTPREIVHYMCQQSLINYLATECSSTQVTYKDIETLVKFGEQFAENEAAAFKKKQNIENGKQKATTIKSLLSESIRNNTGLIDKKLADIKVCDPAIGSGAFPVGMMSEIVKVRNALSTFISGSNRSIYNFKRECIEKSLYGVDIDPGAVEIAKLRLWLSLVVDEDNIKEIKPLPNLDYKIMQGNSLLEEFEGIKLFDEKIIHQDDTDRKNIIEKANQKISELQREYFELHHQDKLTELAKQALEQKIKEQQKIIQSLRQKTGEKSNGDLFKENDEIKAKWDELTTLHKEIINETNCDAKRKMLERATNMEWEFIEMTLKEQGKISSLEKLEEFKRSNTKPFFLWKLHFSDVFEDKGGFDVVIANPPYVQIKQISWDSRKIYEQKFKSAVGRFNIFYFFLELTGALIKKLGISAFIVPDRLLLNTQCDELRKWLLNEQTITEIDSFDEGVFEAVVDSIIIIYKNIQSSGKDIKVKNQTTLSTLSQDNMIKIPVTYFLNSPSNQFDLSYNLFTAKLIEKIKLQSIVLGKISEIKDGIIQGEVADKLFLNKPFDEDSKHLLFGKDISKYLIRFNNNWVNYKPSEMMRIEVKRRGKGIRHGLWMRTPEIFERNKILTRQTADEIIAVYDTENYYYSNTLHGTTITNSNYHPLYVLALLNSKLMTWYYRSTTAEEGKVFAQIKIELLRLLPIKELSNKAQQPFVTLVDQIFTSKQKDPSTDTSALERQIDRMVYKLYGLTEEEIKVVDEQCL